MLPLSAGLSVLLPLVLLTILWPRFFLYQLPWTGLCYSYFFLELCGKSGVVAALVHNSFMAECVWQEFCWFPVAWKERGSYFEDGRWARKKAGRVGREREKRSSSKFKLEIKLHPFHKKGVIKACSHRLQLHQRTSQKNDINYWIWWSLLRNKCVCVWLRVCVMGMYGTVVFCSAMLTFGDELTTSQETARKGDNWIMSNNI